MCLTTRVKTKQQFCYNYKRAPRYFSYFCYSVFLLHLHNSVYITFDPKDDNMQLVLHHYVCEHQKMDL